MTGGGIVLSAGRPPDVSPPFIPADKYTEELERCLSHSSLSLLYGKESKGNRLLLFSLIWFPYDRALTADMGAGSPSLKPHNCAEKPPPAGLVPADLLLPSP